MPVEWALSIPVTILKEKALIRNCVCYGAMKLRMHGTKEVERVLEKRLSRILTTNEMQSGFTPERGIISAEYILRWL